MFHPLAIMNIFHNKNRSITSIVGISFVIMIVFFQMGMYDTVLLTSMQIYHKLDFDIIIISQDYFHVGQAFTFSRNRIYQCSGILGVKKVVPFYLSLAPWRNPNNGKNRPILVMGFNTNDKPFKIKEIQQNTTALSFPNSLLFDRRSRSFYGPREIGVTSEIAEKEFKITGLYSMGGAFISTGTVVVSDQNYLRIFPHHSLEDVSFGLVHISKGAKSKQIALQIQRALGKDVVVLTRQQLELKERKYWAKTSSIGLILGSGVVVVFLVGIVILSQVLAIQVMNHIAEYATLKAFGFGKYRLVNIVLQQAFAFIVVSFGFGVILVLIFYEITSALANVPVAMTLSRMLWVMAMTIVMGIAASVSSLRKVILADPADVF